MHAQVKPCPTCFIHTQHAISIRHLWQASLACMCFSPPDRLSLAVAERAKTLSRVKTFSKKNSTTLPRFEHGKAEYIYIYGCRRLTYRGSLIEGGNNICFNSQARVAVCEGIVLLQQINISYKGERLMNFSHYKSRDTEGVFVQLCSIASSGSVWSGGKRLVLEIDTTFGLRMSSWKRLHFSFFFQILYSATPTRDFIEECDIQKTKGTKHELIL